VKSTHLSKERKGNKDRKKEKKGKSNMSYMPLELLQR
jgi:hypothetical protein